MIAPLFKQKARPYLSGEKPTFATVLLTILLQSYGLEVLEYDGATIQMEVKDDFDVEMPRRVYDQVMALITALTTDLVYTDVETFDEICNALCRKGLGSYRGVPPAIDIAWAVNELKLADPEPVGRSKNPWGPEITAYMRVVLDDEGISLAPKSLPMVDSKPPTSRETQDPGLFAASWHSKQTAADEIDKQVEDLKAVMLSHLEDLGIKATPSGPKVIEGISANNVASDAIKLAQARQKTAEWTSPENRDTHVQKHWYEFGSPEDYLAAERQHASAPAGDEEPRDIRCKVKKDGTLDCTMSYHSPSRGTLHVKRLSDGRTVTLYKPTASVGTQTHERPVSEPLTSSSAKADRLQTSGA